MTLFFVLLALLLFVLDYQYHQWLSHKHPGKAGKLLFAKFTPGAIVSEIRNKIAATVYTRNKYGAAIRNRVTPINRRSSGQTSNRQILAAYSSGWRSLSAAQRAGWNSAAANFPQQDNLGNTIYLTGAQLYARCNANLELIGGAPITDAPNPTSFDVLSLNTLTVDASDGTVELAFAPTVPAGYTMVVRGAGPVSAGKDFFGKSQFRFLKGIAAAQTSPQSLGAEYVGVFGAITSKAGQKVALEAFLMETASGLAGIPVRINSVIVP